MLTEDRCRPCDTALLLVLFGMLRVPTCCGSRQSFLAESKTIIGFRFRGELARNEKMPVGESRLPQSLHHLVFGCDGLLYASSFISRCVCVRMRVELYMHTHGCGHARRKRDMDWTAIN